MALNSFSTFWHGGELSNFEKACLATFVRQGHQVSVFSYHPLHGLPEGVERRDARDIVDEAYLDKFIVFGKPSIAHFSDFFRLKLFAHSNTIWIDSDVVLLKPLDWPEGKRLFGKEQADSICNAVLHFPVDDPELPAIVAKAQAMAGREIPYGATGKVLLMDHLGAQKTLASALEPSILYPVHYDEFWKVFLPERREECEVLCKDATAIHLWNNIIERLGLWKEIAPPVGSYLHKVFTDTGVIGYFDKTYPEKVVKAVVRNYLQTDTGLLTLAKLMVPAAANTFRRKILGQRQAR